MSLCARSFAFLGLAVVLSACSLATGDETATTPAASEALTSGTKTSHPVARIAYLGSQSSGVAINDSWVVTDALWIGTAHSPADLTVWNDVTHQHVAVHAIYYGGSAVLLQLDAPLPFAGAYPSLSSSPLVDGSTVTCTDASNVADLVDAGVVAPPTQVDDVLSGGYVSPFAGRGGGCFVGNTLVALEDKAGTVAQRLADVSLLESWIATTISAPAPPPPPGDLHCRAGTRLCLDHCVVSGRACD